MNNKTQIKKLEEKIINLEKELEKQVHRLSSFIEKNSDNIYINVSAIKQMPNIDGILIDELKSHTFKVHQNRLNREDLLDQEAFLGEDNDPSELNLYKAPEYYYD